jgi:hypothetical protein
VLVLGLPCIGPRCQRPDQLKQPPCGARSVKLALCHKVRPLGKEPTEDYRTSPGSGPFAETPRVAFGRPWQGITFLAYPGVPWCAPGVARIAKMATA